MLSLTGEGAIWWLDVNNGTGLGTNLFYAKEGHNLKPSASVISTAVNKNSDVRFQRIVFFLIPTQPWSSLCFPFYTELKRKVLG